jgi:hypothetical protein
VNEHNVKAPLFSLAIDQVLTRTGFLVVILQYNNDIPPSTIVLIFFCPHAPNSEGVASVAKYDLRKITDSKRQCHRNLVNKKDVHIVTVAL